MSLAALPSSAARVAGENGPSVRRAFGHAASPRRSARHPGLPVSRARRSPAAPPDCALVCFGQRPKRSRRFIRLPPPVAPFACSRRANLPSKHTHERGSISSGWPPNQPASRIAKLFGAGGARGQVGPVRAVALAAEARLENFCARQAGGCAVPDPDRFGEPDIRPCHHTHVVVPRTSGEPTWLTIKRTPTRPLNSSG